MRALASVVQVMVGIELMVLPSLVAVPVPVADSVRSVGPVIAAVGFVSAFAITAGVRWLNLLPGAWLVVAPLVLHHPPSAAGNSVVAGVLTLVLTLPDVGQSKLDRYGGGWRSLWQQTRSPT
jgi:hypothetical protein